MLRELEGNSGADASGRASHDGDFSCKVHGFVSWLRFEGVLC
jgi:hypothetical protein